MSTEGADELDGSGGGAKVTATVDGLFAISEGVGDPVLLIHGLSLDSRMWEPQVQPLLESGRRVIRYDLRGFGRSAPAGANHVFEADDVPRVLDHFSVDRADVVGLSLGGAITGDVGIHHADRVRSLVFVDSALGGQVFEGEYLPINAQMAQLARTRGVEAAKEAWLACDLFKPARRHPALKAKLAEMVADYSGSLWLSDRRFLHNDTWQRVAEVTATTLVIVGALDLDDFQHSAEWISSRVLGARKHVLPDSGHMSNMEQSAAFNEELLAFLDERP